MLSRYSVIGKLGSGGMGVVYRAEDLTLERPVALKFLGGALLSHELTRARFLREARTAAALNHPNVCTIYEVGEVEPGEEQVAGGGGRLQAGTPFIAMELVEGRPLEAIVRERGSVPLDALLPIALQLAEGMAAAHARGIVHRDLKPGNVMVTPEGRVKILDFGLAKPLEPARPCDAAGSAAETASAELTREGLVIGTAAYMAPEQAKGEPVDSRSDVFSFGVVLYELATGTRAFRGATTLSTLAKIIESEPEPIPESRTDIPVELRRIIRRCLQKRPEDRYNDTRDLVAALKALRQETTSGAPRMASGDSRVAPEPSVLRRWSVWRGAAGLVLVAAVAGLFLVRTWDHRGSAAAPAAHRQLTYTGTARAPVLSPDGQFVAYVETGASGGDQLTVQDLSGGQPLVIASAPGIGTPRWTPDGTELLAVAFGEDGVGMAHLVPRLGGAPRRFPMFQYLAWAPDGARFAGANQNSREITIVDKATGDRRTVPIGAPSPWFLGLAWSPTGRHFAIVTYADEKNLSTIWTLPSAGGPPERVVDKEILFSPRFSLHGDALYYLSGRSGSPTSSLWKVPIDPESGRAAGGPALVLATLEIPSFPPVDAAFALSRDGTRLSYARNTTRANLWLAELDARSEGGIRTTQLTSGTALDVSPRFSPDGRSVAFVRGNNLFVLRLDGSAPEPLTFGDADHFAPAWSPDGREIAFISQERGTSIVSRIGAAGGEARPFARTLNSGDRAGDLAWSPGARIVYQRAGNRNFALLDPATGEETPLFEDGGPGFVFRPRYSPDGSRVAFYWSRPDGPGEGTWVVSLDRSVRQRLLEGFVWPLGWTPDGTCVYVIASTKKGPSMAFAGPEVLKMPARGGPAVATMKLPFKEVNVVEGGNDVAPDGRSFVFSVPDSRSDAWLIENFDPDLR